MIVYLVSLLLNLKQHLFFSYFWRIIPANIYLLKDNNRNTRTRSEICWKLTIKTPEKRHWRRHVPLCFVAMLHFISASFLHSALLKKWNIFKVNNKETRTTSGALIFDFEQIFHHFRAFLLFFLLNLNKYMFIGNCYETLERIEINLDELKIDTKWVNFTFTRTAKKKKSIEDFLRKCDQRPNPIWSQLLKKSLMKNFIFCAMTLIVFSLLPVQYFYICIHI